MDIKQKVLEENAKLHDKFAKFHTRAVPYQSRFITKRYIWSLIKEQLRLNNIDPKNKKVLEVACGTGTFIDLFKKLKVSSYEGMDLSKEMIKYAKINHPNTNFYNSSLEDFYKKHKNEYDIIISASFLHHLHDLEDGLKQIKSMLTKNGIYIAIHEEINHKWSSIEIFDNDLSLLLGYQEAASYSIIKRLKVFFKKYNPLKLIKLINN